MVTKSSSANNANTAGAASAGRFDVKRSLLETFAVNQKANEFLLANISDQAWCAPTPTGKGRTIAAIAAHMHNVRLMWLAAADKTAKVPPKLDDEKVTQQEVSDALRGSAAAITKLLETGFADPAGKVPNFKPDVVTFIGYLIAHDAHHRGQIAMLARQVGHAIPAKAGFGLWEWGTLWKECGFTR
jgi:uncharacterized damage-inducible protein DinB